MQGGVGEKDPNIFFPSHEWAVEWIDLQFYDLLEKAGLQNEP